jgi:dGTPase
MIISRERLEQIEADCLAPYGMKSRDSRGRRYPEDEHPYRTRYQRDRDRIIHTTAFRRLEYKTQVFVNSEGDYYRTRLTHTIEVAQIGRSIARAIGANEDLTEAICLVHDIGHPAFGHAGEMALQKLMAEHGGFDHNRQSLRVVDYLERRFAEFPGLNLTWELREGIVKHETEYDVSSAEGFEPEKRGLIEAQIANVADETAYSAHDLDDGLRAGLFTPADLAGIELWQRVQTSIGWAPRDPLAAQHEFDDTLRHRMIRRLLGLLITDCVNTTSARLDELGCRSAEDVQRLAHNVCGQSADMHQAMRALKAFLYERMYRHYRLVRMAAKAERVLSELFAAYTAEPAMLPPSAYGRLEDHDDVYRVVCDYLAGMTDRFALDEYQKLFAPHVRV